MDVDPRTDLTTSVRDTRQDFYRHPCLDSPSPPPRKPSTHPSGVGEGEGRSGLHSFRVPQCIKVDPLRTSVVGSVGEEYVRSSGTSGPLVFRDRPQFVRVSLPGSTVRQKGTDKVVSPTSGTRLQTTVTETRVSLTLEDPGLHQSEGLSADRPLLRGRPGGTRDWSRSADRSRCGGERPQGRERLNRRKET